MVDDVVDEPVGDRLGGIEVSAALVVCFEVLEGLPAGLGEPVQVSMPAAVEGGRLAFDLAGRPVISGMRLAKL